VRSGLQRFRAAIYAYSDAGSGGFVNSTYTFVEERWCSWTDLPGIAAVVGDKMQHQGDRIFAFDWEAAPTLNGVILSQDGLAWRIATIDDRPAQRQRHVTGLFVDKAILNLVGPSS